MPHVFISHVSENRQQVERLCRDLREYGIDYWLASDEIKCGVPWEEAIRLAIKKGAFFIACFGREYMDRPRSYMNKELIWAIDELQQRPLDSRWFIPVLFSPVLVPDQGIGGGKTLRSLQHADLSQDWEGGMRGIIASIHDIDLKDIDERLTGGALRDGERDLFQLLLKEFSLSRSDKGSVLSVNLEINTKKITHRDRKDFLKSTILNFDSEATRLQNELDTFLIERIGPEPQKEGFKFRYASGGVLPILHLEGQDYYCLFYRDVYPIGWNIANGSTNTLAELLNPVETAIRELCEELWIVNPGNKLRYVFADDSGKLPDRPEFAVARQIWKAFIPQIDLPNFKETEIRLKWTDGPDELRVSSEFVEPRTISPCYLNINALDFGIEIDRIAHLDIGKDDKVCDGEIIDGLLLNRVVGLFDVEEMNQKVRPEERSFQPQRIFRSAVDRSSEALEQVIDEFISHVSDTGIRSKKKLEHFAETPLKERYDLCPVTRGIIRRYARECHD